jgi:hypothetical protein
MKDPLSHEPEGHKRNEEMNDPRKEKVGWFHKIFGTIILKGQPFKKLGWDKTLTMSSGAALMLLFLIWMVIFKVIPSL